MGFDGIVGTCRQLLSTSPSRSTAPDGTPRPGATPPPSQRPVHRRLLGRPGPPGRARPARLRHHRGLPRPCSPRCLDGPDGRTDQVRGRLDAVLIAARVAPLTSRIGLVPTVTTTHTEPFHVVQGHRHPRLRQQRPGRLARAGVRPARRGRALRPADIPALGRRPRRPGLRRASRAVRRGRRRRRGGPPAVGQLGGRRRDPRRRHRPLHRPRQAALRRLRGPRFCVKGPSIMPAAAAGPAAGHRAGPRAGAVRARRPQRRRRATYAARRRAGAPRSSTRCARRRSAGRRAAEGLRRPGRLPRRRRTPRPSARPGSTSSTARDYASRRARSSPARPAELADLLAGLAPRRARRLPAAPRRTARRPRRDHRRDWCPSCSAAVLSAPPTRRPRSAVTSACPPARQPLRPPVEAASP